MAEKKLSRVLKPFGVLLITLSIITPASSFFIITPGIIAISGTGALLSYVFAALLALCLAVLFAELASAFPMSGGHYTMVGKTMGRFSGFLIFVLSLLIPVFMKALFALSIANYLGFAIGGRNQIIVGIIAIALVTVIAAVKIKVNAIVTGVFLGIELFLLLLIAIAGLMNIQHPIGDLLFHPSYIDPATKSLSTVPLGLIIGTTAAALFSLGGYEYAVYFGEETVDARKNMGGIILIAFLLSVITQVIPLIGLLLGTSDLHSLLSSTRMIPYFIEQHFGHNMTIIASLVIAATIFNAMIGCMLGVARLVFSTARDCIWFDSANTVLSYIHPKFASPFGATLFIGVLSSLACFLGAHLLILISSTLVIAIYFFACIAVIVGRANQSTLIGHYRMPLYPLPPIVVMLALIYIVYETWFDLTLGRPSLIITGVILVLAAIYYLLFLSRKKNWQLRGPDDA